MKRTPYKFRANNAMLRGKGSNTTQNRGSGQSIGESTNPYYSNNYMYRWQEWNRLYYTSWEARKIIDIPIDDMLRVPFEIRGLEEYDKKIIEQEWNRLDLDRQIRRAFKQERLLGGCTLLGVFSVPEKMKTDDELYLHVLKKGCLAAVNLVDISRLSMDEVDTDPFSPDYDRRAYFTIDGVKVHTSRLIVLDGDFLYSRSSQMMFQNFRYNPCGFGDSKLATLYDLLIRETGTQEGAYHLVNMASVLLVEARRLKSLEAVGSPAMAKLEELVQQISMYRGAIIDGDDVKVAQHSASFGSVPELVMTFAQLLSAASDIPATRFLSQAPGGLNATGDSDLQNYYNMIDSIRQTKLKCTVLKLLDWIGTSLFTFESWIEKKVDLEIHFPPLWNLTALDQSTVDNTYVSMVSNLVMQGLMNEEDAVAELNARNIFSVELDKPEPMDLGAMEGQVLQQGPQALGMGAGVPPTAQKYAQPGSSAQPGNSGQEAPDATPSTNK